MCKPDSTSTAYRRPATKKEVEGRKEVAEAESRTNNNGDSLSTSNSNDSIGSGIRITTTAVEDKTITEKLFQAKEDRFYAHKILGFSALASYIYRFSNMGQADGNFDASFLTLVFVIHHLSLNVTSFVFDIPKRRIRSGFRIWPEYRIHSLVFASRNLACILRLWFIQRYYNNYNMDSSPISMVLHNGVINWVIVMATCAAADYGSYLSREYQSPTIRGTDYLDPFGNWFASEMQFQLTAVALSGAYQRYSLHLVGAFIIQFNSFLMTLRRKNVFSHLVLTTTYGIMLVGAMLTGMWEDVFTDDQLTRMAAFANVGIILRMGLGVNKYIVWTVLACGMKMAQDLEPHLILLLPPHYRDDPMFYYTIAFWMTKIVCFCFGLRRRSQVLRQRREKKNKEGKQQEQDVGNGAILGPENAVVLTAGAVFSVLMAFDMLDVFGIL